MKRRKPLVITLSIILVLGLGFFLFTRFYLFGSLDNDKQDSPKIDSVSNEYKEYKELWESNHSINSDYIGQLWFESGLLNQPIMKAENNEKYFRTDWQTMLHDEEGSPFVDYRNDVKSDQNIIIYGHNVETSYEVSRTHKFTPLHVLEDEQGIEDNKYIYFLLEDRLLKYEVAIVYKAEQYLEFGKGIFYQSAPKFFEQNFSSEQFDTFLAAAKKYSYNDYETYIDYNDKLLTLQTCIDGSIDKFVVTAKLVETIYIN